MLLDYLVEYCDSEYKKVVCEDCNHPSECSGNCSNCLDEIHWPDNNPFGKEKYDCIKMLNYYVCKYSYKYCSEIQYALNILNGFKDLDYYKIMSIGCGAVPDLMAIEQYIKRNGLNTPVEYKGYDINKLWKSIHGEIKRYCDKKQLIFDIRYVDAIEYFKKYYVENVNVLVLQYVISYFYNTDQICEIESFFDDLIRSIILRKDKGKQQYIIINDVNSCYRGRDYFLELLRKLKENDLHGLVYQMYFDYKIRNKSQRFGDAYGSVMCLHRIPNNIIKTYSSARYCSSAQLLIEVR